MYTGYSDSYEISDYSTYQVWDSVYGMLLKMVSCIITRLHVYGLENSWICLE